jgi:hypothetical protein
MTLAHDTEVYYDPYDVNITAHPLSDIAAGCDGVSRSADAFRVLRHKGSGMGTAARRLAISARSRAGER